MLDFGQLQSQLRRAISARIASGQISGIRLARMTGFQQAHISNFLHGRRGLSTEGMDRVLATLGMSVLDLIPQNALEQFVHAGSDSEYEAIPLVNRSALHIPLPPSADVHDWTKLKRTFLNKLRPHAIGRRDHWLRFVLMHAAKQDVEAMYPRIQHGATLLVDRHYNSFVPHRAAGVNICVARLRENALVRSLDCAGRQLVLRPEQSRVPLEMMTIDPKERYAQKILGRVCWVGYEV
jgi:transcriptional regulator with XRE-family HTH domain